MLDRSHEGIPPQHHHDKCVVIAWKIEKKKRQRKKGTWHAKNKECMVEENITRGKENCPWIVHATEEISKSMD